MENLYLTLRNPRGLAFAAFVSVLLSVSAGCKSTNSDSAAWQSCQTGSTFSKLPKARAEARAAGILPTQSVQKIDGEEMRAIGSVLEMRHQDPNLTSCEKALAGFYIAVTELPEVYEVSVVPLPDEGGSVGGGTAFGRNIVYLVRKTDYQVIHSHGTK